MSDINNFFDKIGEKTEEGNTIKYEADIIDTDELVGSSEFTAITYDVDITPPIDLELMKKADSYPDKPPDDKAYCDEREVIYKSVKSDTSLAKQAKSEMVINKITLAVEAINAPLIEGVIEYKDTSYAAEDIRGYDKKAEMPKIVFAKANEGTNSAKKWLLFIVACIITGIVFGIQANSYYIYKDGKVNNNLSCAYSWLTAENMPIRTSPFHSDVFTTGMMFGAGVLGIVGLFIYLDNEQKKASRVGHEHGSAHLAKNSDHKTYTARFMDAPTSGNTANKSKSKSKPKKKGEKKVEDKPNGQQGN